MNDDRVTRRTYLTTLIATSVTGGIAGCNSSPNTSNPDTTTTETPTATPNHAPQILTHDAIPQDNGTTLDVALEGEDDHELSLARIEYAGKTVEEAPESASVSLNGKFTELDTTDLDTTPGQVTFLLRDSAGKETRANVNPDETAPEFQTFSVEPTENAREIEVRLEGRDGIGLEEVQLLLGDDPQLQESVSVQKEYTTDQTVGAPEDAQFQQNTVTASLQDWNGNTTETDADTYVRKYDVMDDARLDIGAVYIPWAGDKFGKCIDQAEPTIGRYNDPISPETTSKHIDQMQRFGITNILLNFNGTRGDRQSIREFTKSELAGQTKFRPFYTIQDYRWNPDDDSQDWKSGLIPSDMEFIRDNVLAYESAFELDGKPLFNIWNAGYIPWNDAYHTRIMDGWGDYQNFVSDIKSHLRVDGEEPFIVGGTMGPLGYHGFESAKSQITDFMKELDATSSWVASGAWGEDHQATWEEVLPWVEENYRGHRNFVDSHDMEFIPMVFPGFDDRMNTCWGQDRLTPRSQKHFADLLKLADKYRTTDMIDIATWNDWTEGTQIEPGSFKGTDYGTEYLEIVEEFQGAN